MIAALYLLAYLCCGVLCVRWLLPRHPVLNRIWLGASLGVLLMMWLPTLLSAFCSFTWLAHGLALIPLLLLTLLCWFLRDKHPVKEWDAEETRQLKQLLWIVVPLTVLSGYLQYTHCLREDSWGNLNVGQSTYGDLPMHLSFITGMIGSSFPMNYPFCPGVQLCYPYLTDALSASFYLMGWSLSMSVVIPGTLMMALCYMGVMLLAREMTLGKKTIVLATLLFFLNGGLGFLYDFDLAGGTESDGTLTVWSRIQDILEGYYKTPTNQPDPNNLRWSNVIADLMIPQRTLLGGWCMVIPCFYLLYSGFDPEKRGEKGGLRTRMLLGVWGGALPLIHTHSFLALGLCSAGMMCYDLIHEQEERRVQLLRYLGYAGVVLVLALPQLLGFTFRQALSGQESSMPSFLSFHFNWVNNEGGTNVELKDLYFWFYIKNIGLPFLLLILAWLEKDRHMRRLLWGAAFIFLAAELVRFQPNVYDNNKLFYLGWLLCCMAVADYAARLWRRLKGLRARPLIAVGFTVVTFLSAGLTLWRECVSDYQAFSWAAVETADWVKENTDQDAVFLTGTQHLNPVSSLAGRTTVCGPDLWLYYHGIDTSERKEDLRAFFSNPEENLDVLTKYDVDYIMVSSYERSDYDIDEAYLEESFEVVFSNWEATIYKVPEG